MNKNQKDQPVNDKVIEIIHELDPSFKTNAGIVSRDLDDRLKQLQEILDYLRVCIKYQAFDLEATRRENVFLRERLERGRKQ